MIEIIDPYWPFILPPLLGAIIGYVTNYIAIRMLFRPLRPWHIFGLRLPLTPGIIPSQRHKLATKMGEMVGSHLLTTDDVTLALDKPQFRHKLHQAVAAKLDNFIGQELGPLITLLPQRFHNRFFDLIDILRWKFIKHLKNYVSDESFQQRLNSFILQQLNLTLAHDLKHYLTPERQHQTQEKLEPLLERWLTSNSLSENVSTFIDSRIDTVICSGKSLKQLLPAEIIDTILNQLEDELPALLQQLATNLNDPRMRKELEKKARGGIESFIDSVEGLSAIITALFDMEKIYSRLPEFMDKAALELATWLEGEKVRSEISTAMRERINNWLDQPLANYLEKVSYEKIINIKRFISTRVITFIRSNNCRQLVVEWLNKGIDTIKDRPLSELLNEAGGEDCAAKLAEQITTKAVQITQSPQLQQTVEAELEQKVNFWINERPLGNLASRLPSDAREELYHALFEQLLELLNKEVPPLVDSLDIRRIVEDKVNSLDILKVEELLMGIMKEQFKYINIFGALLGMLIGMLNIFLLR